MDLNEKREQNKLLKSTAKEVEQSIFNMFNSLNDIAIIDNKVKNSLP